jgi:hypothetical protein
MTYTTTTDQSIAHQFEMASFDWDRYENVRPSNATLLSRGGVCIESSNDNCGNGGWSFGPTELWKFPDGSYLEVGYSTCNQTWRDKMMTEQSLANIRSAFEEMALVLEKHNNGLLSTDEAMLALDKYMFHAHDAWEVTRSGEIDLNTGLRMP